MICSVDGCDRPTKNSSNPLCYGHYMRKWRYGDPEHVLPPRRKYDEPPTCRISGCEGAATRKGLCNMHYKRMRTYGDPTLGQDRSLPDHQLSYAGAHQRVRVRNGRPSEHLCACGKQAVDWAYLHNAGDEELVEYLRKGLIVGWAKYSPNPDHYAAMCRSCHVRFDKSQKNPAGRSA